MMVEDPTSNVKDKGIRSHFRPFSVLLVPILVVAGMLSAPQAVSADTGDPLQTVTYLGGVLQPGQPVGTLDTTTDFSLNGGATWQPAYLVGGSHPWGLVPDTNSWINCGPSLNSCLNQTVDYRVRFVVPAGFSDPTIALDIIADNAGTLFLNGIQISPRFEGGGSIPPVSVVSSMVVGTNTMILRVEDWGGLAGFNYRAVITMNAPSPIVTLPAALPVPVTANDCKNNGWKSLVDTLGRAFKNQGDCVSFVVTKGKNGANG